MKNYKAKNEAVRKQQQLPNTQRGVYRKQENEHQINFFVQNNISPKKKSQNLWPKKCIHYTVYTIYKC